MNSTAVIIVNWNAGKLLAQCVRSLLLLPECDLITSIVVVDNASGDNSINELRAAAGSEAKVYIIELPKNEGFAKANNYAISRIASQKMSPLPHILLLNPDTIVHPGAIAHMVKLLEEDPTSGIIGPKLLNADNSLQPSVRKFPNLVVMLALILKLPRFLNGYSWWRRYLQIDFDYNRKQSVDQVMGAAFLIRNKLISSLGMLDEHFFVWFEEVDYCVRAKTSGWQVLYTPAGSIVHYGGVSFDQLVGHKRVVPWLKSIVWYTHKHLGFGALVIVLLALPLGILLAFPASLWHMYRPKFKHA